MSEELSQYDETFEIGKLCVSGCQPATERGIGFEVRTCCSNLGNGRDYVGIYVSIAREAAWFCLSIDETFALISLLKVALDKIEKEEP